MGNAVRAIIFKDNQILVMHRNKHGSEYYTLVGGRVHEQESLEQALAREVKEETGLDVTAAQLVFTEHHQERYNDQYIFLCQISPSSSGTLEVQPTSEEAFMNKIDLNTHKPLWVDIHSFARLPFFTGQLQTAIMNALQQGFPTQPMNLS